MFSTIYTALSGMLGFSKGLDVISNNIANLNTPGFKSSELEFRDLFYRYTQGGGSDQQGERSQIGAGLDTKGTRTAFREGEMQDSGSHSTSRSTATASWCCSPPTASSSTAAAARRYTRAPASSSSAPTASWSTAAPAFA